MKHFTFKLILAFFFMGTAMNVSAFNVVNDEGQRIYYSITSGTNREVSVTYASLSTSTSGSTHYTGNVIIPSEITYNDAIYTVTSIGKYAFFNCKQVESVQLPSTITSIGNYAFYDCVLLSSINIPEGVTEIGNLAFFDCTSLTSIEIPSSVKTLRGKAFSTCTNLKKLILHEGLNEIELGVFEYCSSLKEVYLPTSVTIVARGAFNNCTSLESVSFPSTIIQIGNEGEDAPVFDECVNLQSIYCYMEEPCTFELKCFNDTTYNNAILYVPTGKKEVYKSTDYWHKFMNIAEFDVTAVKEIDKDVKIEVARYTIEGKKISSPQKGINILRMNDGTTQKVLVK